VSQHVSTGDLPVPEQVQMLLAEAHERFELIAERTAGGHTGRTSLQNGTSRRHSSRS
jgi:hypothetical protein